MEEVLFLVHVEYGATPSAVCSNASGEALKARRMLAKKYPELVVPDCAAHQASDTMRFGAFYIKSNFEVD